MPESDGIEYYEDLRYGYLWWSAEVDGREVWMARGHGGQLVVIAPDLDLVVVATSWDFDDDFSDAPLEHEKAILSLIATDVIPAAE